MYVTYDVFSFANKLKEINYKVTKNNKKIPYIELPCSFDIETSSFMENGEKRAIMYAFALNINHIIYLGRKWSDFLTALETLKDVFNLSVNRIVIYIHNLSYEFQFMCKRLEWSKIFALEERKLIYAISDNFEFRCSYLLSGYSLEKLAIIYKLPVEKLVGELDYSKIRHSLTPLETKEEQYLLNDTEVVVYYIEYLLTKERSIGEIPITKTAFVRRYCRKECLSEFRYKKIMQHLTLTLEDYQYCKKAFAGGFTHANMFNASLIHDNVASYDFTSSYPAVMVSEKFPMSKGITFDEPSDEIIEESLRYFCCILEVTFTDIHSKLIGDNPISESKCKITGRRDTDNGRVIAADELTIVITEQDYHIINDFYDYEDIHIHKIIRFAKAYLPTKFVECILKLYEDKTKLKGIEGREDEYLTSKEMLNSLYGMSVTDILRDEILYENNEWLTEEKDAEKAINIYNKSYSRFLFYPWGIWVTAYARRNLFTAIKECHKDYIYADTDSVKITNMEEHLDYFEKYNIQIQEKIKNALFRHDIPIEKASPQNSNGKVKWLGVWEYEGTYSKFKTLGAKRYMTLTGDELSITVSGLNKKIATPHILDLAEVEHNGCKILDVSNAVRAFDIFDDGLYLEKGKTGKNIHTYIDTEISGVVEDYTGIKMYYNEKSCVHLEEADYNLSLIATVINKFLGGLVVK